MDVELEAFVDVELEVFRDVELEVCVFVEVDVESFDLSSSLSSFDLGLELIHKLVLPLTNRQTEVVESIKM